jgi:hypothetical protein
MLKTRAFLLLGGVPDADAQSLIAAMTVRPSSQRQALISTTIKMLKAPGVWSKIDALYMTAAHGVVAGTSQAGTLNWKNPGTWTLVPTNSPVFLEDRGVMGDGASSYLIANGYNPSTAGGNYSLNSATIGAWIQQAGSIANGTSVAIGALARILVNGAATAYSTRVNDGTALISSPASLLTTHWAGRRLSSAGKDLWRAGTQYNAVDAIASSSIASTFIVGSATSAAGFGNDRIACAYTAAGLSDAEMVAMHAALQFYMQGVGIA